VSRSGDPLFCRLLQKLRNVPGRFWTYLCSGRSRVAPPAAGGLRHGRRLASAAARRAVTAARKFLRSRLDSL
jgi:hypothetical protein